MSTFLQNLKELTYYRSAIFGLLVILGLIVWAIYAVVAVPYDQAIQLWRGGEEIWGDYPKNVPPQWSAIFSGKNLPTTIVLNSRQGGEIRKESQVVADDMRTVDITMPFHYPFDGFPNEINLFLESKFQQRKPHLNIFWRTPDGRQIPLGEFSIGATERFGLSIDQRLTRRLGGLAPEVGLFADPATVKEGAKPVSLKGKYELVIEGLVFEKGSDIDAKLVLYGQVHGLAGTDHRRRDIMIALLWGAPIALAFGFLAAVGSTLLSFSLAAIGSWFGGWVDGLIQRLTEVNVILPVLPILILIGTFYSRSIWVILGVVILLSIFSPSIKVYRSMFLQVKELPYIEAARAYGANDLRLVFRYMMPKVLPVLIPSFVTLIPSYVFLEASLAVLGLGDPVLPTWGKVLNDAYSNGALYKGMYYWVLEPAVLLMVTGLGFATVGFALDRIFNPRLREV